MCAPDEDDALYCSAGKCLGGRQTLEQLELLGTLESWCVAWTFDMEITHTDELGLVRWVANHIPCLQHYISVSQVKVWTLVRPLELN